MLDDGGTGPGEDAGVLPQGVQGRLSRLEFALRNAADVNEITCCLLDDLVSLPHVRRAGLALTEGAGRRLRFTARDAGDERPGEPDWCHIDAYDDVPLTTVARTGDGIAGDLATVAQRYPALAAHQERHAARSVAVVALPGVGSPMGGLIAYFDDDSALAEPTRRLLEVAARRVSDAVRRARVTAGRGPDDPGPGQIVPGAGGRRAEQVLASDARSAGLARQFLRDRLREWEVDPDVVDGAQLCLSELVTNAIMHAGTTSELLVHLEDGVLTVVVRDVGATARPGVPATYLPVPEDDDPLRVFGRGLTLVDALADRWGSEQDAYGTTAWFALELARGDDASRTG